MKKFVKVFLLLSIGFLINDVVRRLVYNDLYRQALERYSDEINRPIDTRHFE